MDILSSLSSDPMLLDFAAGAALRFTKPIQPLLAPTVKVGTAVGRYKKFTRDTRLTLPQHRRMLGGHAVQVGVELHDEQYECLISALDCPIDNVLTPDFKWLIPDALEMLAETEQQILELETINTAFEAAGAGEGMLWDDVTDPIKAIDAALLEHAKNSRSDNLGVAFGSAAWHIFKNHKLVLARGGMGSVSFETHPNLFHTGARFGTCYSLLDTAPPGVDEALDWMFPASSILLVSRTDNPTRRDPSFMKTFRLRNPTQGIKVTQTADGRISVVQNDWAVDLKVTNDEGVARFNITES